MMFTFQYSTSHCQKAIVSLKYNHRGDSLACASMYVEFYRQLCDCDDCCTDADGSTAIYKADSMRKEVSLDSHGSGVNDVIWLENCGSGNFIATGADDKDIRIWDVNKVRHNDLLLPDLRSMFTGNFYPHSERPSALCFHAC